RSRAVSTEYRHRRPREGRRGPHDRRSFHGSEGVRRRLHHHQGRRPRRRAGVGTQARGRDDAADRGPAVPGGSLLRSEIERVFREEYGRAVAVLVRLFGNIDAAEEAVQDALRIAIQQWPSTGLPPRPAGWIITTARPRAIDRFRRDSSREERHAEAARIYAAAEADQVDDLMGEDVVRDDRLRLIFTCCHP